VREHLARELACCRVFVLTLGLAEAWYDAQAGRHLNNTPGPRVMAKFGARLSVQLTGFAHNLAALQALHAELAGRFADGFKLVVTVSPVPLERTFLAGDVVVMNHYAKAMLCAAAQEFAATRADVDYFQSFEMVTCADPARAWEWDGRHVKPRMVAHVMSAFRQHYVGGGA
jgi:GSCFA family